MGKAGIMKRCGTTLNRIKLVGVMECDQCHYRSQYAREGSFCEECLKKMVDGAKK